ncbi:unnamed protein product [Toxocara canis]|uniref:Ubiquitinyl hydrolase 1 n=1 Tax=Toxocara canis TaxID=6265 RepID=A0A183V9Z4_TOXCA|nr:unnamed protein product [Toxocara canis]
MPSRTLGVFSSCSCVNIHLDEDGAVTSDLVEFSVATATEPTASRAVILIYLSEHLEAILNSQDHKKKDDKQPRREERGEDKHCREKIGVVNACMTDG